MYRRSLPLLLAAPALARAQGFPNRPVRIVVPLAPGGSTDVVARAIAPGLSARLGQPVIVENRPGANGWIAIEFVARQPADGHVLICNNVSTHALNEAMAGPDRRIRPSRDLLPITNLVEIPQLMLAPGNLPARSIPEFVDMARRAAQPMTFASAGVGSYQHIDITAFAARAGIQLLHLPMRGAGEMLAPVIRGDAQLTKLGITSVLEQVRAGTMRALAADAPARLPLLPDVPTMAESGFPGDATTLWSGLFAPTGTPDAVVALLHRHIAELFQDPGLRAAQENPGGTVAVSASPAAFGDYVARDVARWVRLTRQFNITLDS